ncbi:MAG: hypothetical protein WCL06_00985 [Bacteroidota bacterium]
MKHLVVLAVLLFLASNVRAQNMTYQTYAPCTFSVELPSTMSLSKMYEDESLDHCEYEAKLPDGFVVLEMYSLLSSRFDYTSVQELYDAALKASELNITYKMKSENYFVISGLDKKSGNIVYWKRCMGANFISDLYIEYDTNRKKDIEPYIGWISKSFTSE